MERQNNCINCGAPLPKNGDCCEYCGTRFGKTDSGYGYFGKHAKSITAEVKIPDAARMFRSESDIIEAVAHEAREELIKKLPDYIEIKRMDDPMNCQTVYRARLRVLPIDYRFDGR